MKNKKSLGQHWLKNRAILDKIATLAAEGSAYEGSDITEVERQKQLGTAIEKEVADTVVEIGPGLGTLTSSLLKRFNKVIAVEYDEKLAQNLPKSFPGKNLEVVNADILQYDFGNIEAPYAVAGNIPYYITSPIIEKLITLDNVPVRIVLLIQKEVAERIVADKETILSLVVKNRADAELGPVVVRQEFTPPPKVDSQVIILTPHKAVVQPEVFGLIRRGFVAPRKKLIHNLAGLKSKEELASIFEKIGISVDARPGDLRLADWQRLYEDLAQK